MLFQQKDDPLEMGNFSLLSFLFSRPSHNIGHHWTMQQTGRGECLLFSFFVSSTRIHSLYFVLFNQVQGVVQVSSLLCSIELVLLLEFVTHGRVSFPLIETSHIQFTTFKRRLEWKAMPFIVQCSEHTTYSTEANLIHKVADYIKRELIHPVERRAYIFHFLSCCYLFRNRLVPQCMTRVLLCVANVLFRDLLQWKNDNAV